MLFLHKTPKYNREVIFIASLLYFYITICYHWTILIDKREYTKLAGSRGEGTFRNFYLLAFFLKK